MEENFGMEWKIFSMEWKKIASMEEWSSIPCPGLRGVVPTNYVNRKYLLISRKLAPKVKRSKNSFLRGRYGRSVGLEGTSKLCENICL